LAPFENVIRTVLPIVSESAPAEDEPLFEIVEGVSIDDLTTDNLLKILEDKAGLTLTDKQKEIIKNFYLGKLTGYNSANGKRAFRMEYEIKPTGEGDETTLDRKDMITLLLGLVIDVLGNEANRDATEKLLGEEVSAILFNILGMKKAERKQITWLYVPEKVGETFSVMDTTRQFTRGYGPLFTKEMAEYMSANLSTFLDNMVQLLGIPASTFDGLNLDIKSDSGFITSVEDLVDGLLEGTLYKAELIETIRGYILKAVEMINGLPASEHIKEVLRLAIDLDVDYYEKYYVNGELQPIPEFDNSDPENNPLRDQFVDALCDVLKPLYPLLQWLLSDRDISILYNSEGSDLITLFGFEGYRYGIAPIYEALGVDRPMQEEINGKETTEKLLKAIINPLLDRLDEIIDDPVNELFAILPEVAYFINTKGLDVSYKNLLAAVKTVLDAVDPLLPEDAKGKIAPIIAGQFGNLNITELTMQTLLDMVASNLGDGMDTLAFDAVAETTFGQLVSYDSELDYDAYKMQYVDEDSEADALTALLRLALRWIATGENGAKLKALVRENIEMSAEGYDYIDKLIDIVVAYAGTNSGMDSLLHMLYYIFYGIHNGTAAVAGWQRDYNSRFEAIDGVVQELTPRDENLGKVAELLDWLFATYGDGDENNTGNVYHNYDNPDDEMPSPAVGKPKGFAANGFIQFFKQIIEWFKTIFNKIFKH
ncbi:MAG: hypothetical protein IJL00_00370, partial [Clostridia bacterium]|nr:hypothetical protein [Clostridia bacterium]